MNALPFVAAAYAAFALVATALCLGASLRLRTARRRLAALETARPVP